MECMSMLHACAGREAWMWSLEARSVPVGWGARIVRQEQAGASFLRLVVTRV